MNSLHRQKRFDSDISAEDHIACVQRPSRSIFASKSRDVGFFYASKSIDERGSRLGDLCIARINLKLDHSVWDVSRRTCRRERDMKAESTTAINYARVFEEVAFERSITASEISNVEQVSDGLPRGASKFRDFEWQLERCRSSEVALAQALTPLQI
jgi:hypothetical protein